MIQTTLTLVADKINSCRQSTSNQILKRLSLVTTIYLALAISVAAGQGTGIAPGGCVLPGGLPSDLSQVPGSPQYFASLKRGSRRNNNRTQQLNTAFSSVANDMDASLGEGQLVQAYQHFLSYKQNTERYENEIDDADEQFLDVKKRMNVVLEFGVTFAAKTAVKDGTNVDSLMTLMEIANMPLFKTPSQRALQQLRMHKNSAAYTTTLEDFRTRYSIQNLAPNAASETETQPQNSNRVRK